MAKWIVGKGLDHYIAYLQRLDVATDEIVGKAVYEMAKVVADNVKAIFRGWFFDGHQYWPSTMTNRNRRGSPIQKRT